jgi:hypothetical protein
MIDLFGLKAKASKRKSLEGAAKLGEEGGSKIADSLNRYVIRRVLPSLEGALSEFKLRARDAESVAQLQDELAVFLEWLEETIPTLIAESDTGAAEGFAYARALDMTDHFRLVIRRRLTSEIGKVALSAFDYASVIADRKSPSETASAGAGRIEDALVRIGVEEERARIALETY